MSQFEPPHSSESNSRRRTRRPSPSDQSRPRKRQQQTRPARFSPPLLTDRPESATSTATSIDQYYGIGDEDALGNLFASYPQTFSSFPRPHGSQGLHEPPWELRFDHEIHLSNNFPSGRTRSQRVRIPVPGPETDLLLSASSPRSTQRPPTATRAEFESALKLVREVIGEEKRLTIELARSYERVHQWRERWGWSPLNSDAYESPPPYSPPRGLSIQSPQASSPPQAVGSSPFQQSSSPTPDPIPNPPIPGDAAPSAEVLFNWVNTFAKAHGFGIVRRNAYSYKGRKIRYLFQCDRFGEPRPTEGVGIRQRKSRKCGCKWMVVAEALEEDKWLLRRHPNPEHSQHNHGRSIGPSAHPSHRRLTTDIRATVESTSRRIGIRARDVRAVVQEQHPESVFTRKDIYNARSLINRDKLDGYTPTAALIKLFDEREIPYLVKWADDNSNRLLGLVWTFPYCLQMWKRFPEVISFDNTYNTNRFKLPLFQATGQTCLGSVFNAAFGLINNERREGFQFLSESIRQLAEQHSIRQPDIIITDFDDSMKAALNDQFPEVQQQLCIHHINSNVLLRSKQKWVKDCSHDSNSSSLDSSDEEAPAPQTQAELSRKDRHFIHAPAAEVIPHSYQGVLMMWKLVVFAETEEAHEKAWVNLCREFDDQRAILRYRYGTYMPVRAQWARCFIRKYRNFGIRVTSGTEASNNNVKSYLLNGMSHLYRLVEAMQDMIRDQERDFTHASAEDEVLTAREYLSLSSEYLGELRTSISSKSLGLITKQYRLARKAMPTGKNPFPDSLGDCSEDCSVSAELGIPCCHKIYSKIGSGTPFTKWDVHPRWRLRESASRDPYRRILDPKIATALRGRPKNTAQAVPTWLAIGTSSQSSLQAASKPASQPASQASGRRRGRLPGSRNKSTLARLALEESQQASSRVSPSSWPQTRNQSATLGSGRTTGIRASGRRTQPSIRRRRSQWEMVESDEKVLSCITVRK
ncbi:hypothetical protein FOXG_14088 [Fusarium oxysporum f. sp. lycopersici 4287]|uniref:MULE transposase domain-containing protein n=3 Tax=Hypocreales TaxID=5125 RepID=A0A0J9VYM0_FUSO4|nr:hypothetical protein FOXG_12449 [Fusarium oxysporum f. sp. lycopersici 4287]XP_018253650.1 hypothetical protein FOXG_14088 [Fusarium oxysporum f. sp. lycopersici 4287]KNB13731.1 hypothetical protein FOXG_12449 [Fusarium oxysporum f. sp. lycopersici 4287]KNB15605.1 hypothetical protein FOXG_14088 [Fusarium oxysporum f. sp. lycopersici 4287]